MTPDFFYLFPFAGQGGPAGGYSVHSDGSRLLVQEVFLAEKQVVFQQPVVLVPHPLLLGEFV